MSSSRSVSSAGAICECAKNHGAKAVVDDDPLDVADEAGTTIAIEDAETRILRKAEGGARWFSKSDIRVFDEVLTRYRDASFNDLTKLTHKNVAYENAWWSRRKGERAEMYYEEIIGDEKKRAALIEDLDPVSAKTRCSSGNMRDAAR
jgi:hypothetical protein